VCLDPLRLEFSSIKNLPNPDIRISSFDSRVFLIISRVVSKAFADTTSFKRISLWIFLIIRALFKVMGFALAMNNQR